MVIALALWVMCHLGQQIKKKRKKMEFLESYIEYKITRGGLHICQVVKFSGLAFGICNI